MLCYVWPRYINLYRKKTQDICTQTLVTVNKKITTVVIRHKYSPHST